MTSHVRRIRVRVSYPHELLSHALREYAPSNALAKTILTMATYSSIGNLDELTHFLKEASRITFRNRSLRAFMRYYMRWDLTAKFLSLKGIRKLCGRLVGIIGELHREMYEEWYHHKLSSLIKAKVRMEKCLEEILRRAERACGVRISEGIIVVLTSEGWGCYTQPNKVMSIVNARMEELRENIYRLVLERGSVIRRSWIIKPAFISAIEDVAGELWRRRDVQDFFKDRYALLREVSSRFKGPREILRITLHQVLIRHMLDELVKTKQIEYLSDRVYDFLLKVNVFKACQRLCEELLLLHGK